MEERLFIFPPPITEKEDLYIMADTTEKANRSEAQIKAHKKYMEKYCEIKVRMTTEEREKVQKHAQSLGMSATAFIKKAISDTSGISFE